MELRTSHYSRLALMAGLAGTVAACWVYPDQKVAQLAGDGVDPGVVGAQSAPAEPPQAAEQVAAGPCSPRGKLDLEVRRDGLYRGLQTAPPTADVRMVDKCQGTTEPTRVGSTERTRFSPTDGSEFYFLVTPAAPTVGYYPSVSEIWLFPYPELRGDMGLSLVPKGEVRDPQVTGSPIVDVFKGVYDPTKAHFVLEIVEDGCALGGFRPTVVGHPEAVVRYGGTYAVDPELKETAPASNAFVFISGVTPGPGAVEFSGTSGPCKLGAPRLFVPVNTGKYPLVAGTATFVRLTSTSVVAAP
jgi:hypothetical protein